MNHMRIHLQEAIALNKTRLPLYAKLTGNASRAFSRALIRREKLALGVALYFDLSARKFQARGIPIVAEEFVSMQGVPAFSAHYPSSIDYTRPLQKIEHAPAIDLMIRANRQNDFESVQALASSLLAELSSQPHVYCLYRHMLESVMRCAFFAPQHIKTASIMGFRSPSGLSSQLINVHLAYLKSAIHFDESIAFIQYTGVPFIFQDLPPIGLHSNRV